MSTDELTEYERQRLVLVARNREYMARLGVASIAAKIGLDVREAAVRVRKRPIKIKKETIAPTRRSARVVGVKAEFNGEAIDALEDERVAMRSTRKRSAYARAADDREGDAATRTIHEDRLAASREWLADARETLLKHRDKSTSTSSCAWREEAIARWGLDVPKFDAVRDWEAWVKSRVGSPPPTSELVLLQEYFAHDGWQLLIACVLMSRVSSWETKYRCISEFFKAYPTPSAALRANADDIFEIIKSLGLFPGRMRSIVEVTTKFLTHPGEFTVGAEPDVKLYGIGEFGIDSWYIFARNDIHRTPGDSNLQSFVRWQRNHQSIKG